MQTLSAALGPNRSGQNRNCANLGPPRVHSQLHELNRRFVGTALTSNPRRRQVKDNRTRRPPFTGVRSTMACAAALEEAITVEVETGPSNSRRLYAGIDIAAPWSAVWAALTDYEGLHTFIPGLAQNECLSRHMAGCRLLQVGEQSLALGVTFRAKVVLDIVEHASGVPLQMLDDQAVDLGCFPLPRSPVLLSVPHDIAFSLHEGDFQAFRGVWRIQDSSASASAPPTTRLSYALFVRPQRWMPISLIQSRIQGEVRNNLTAVQQYSQLSALNL